MARLDGKRYSRRTPQQRHEKHLREKELWAFHNVRYAKEDFAALVRMAAKRKVSAGELVRTYVEWGLETDS